MNQLDTKDRKILYELDKNARQSITQIAKKVKLKKTTVKYRIDKLIEENIIYDFYTIIDSSKLGYLMFRIYLKFFNTNKENEEEIINWLIKNEKIGVVAKIESNYDLSLVIWTKTVFEFEKLLFEFKSKYRQYFWKEQVHLFTSVYHFKRNYLIEDFSDKCFEFDYIGENLNFKTDELDYKILKLLAKNARIKTVEIALELNLPARTIAYRIKQLEKRKIIVGYRANINLEKINYEYYKINFKLNDLVNYDLLINFAKVNQNIIYIDKTISNFDFEIDVEVKNKKQLFELVEEIKKIILIRDFEFFSYKQYYKMELIP